MLRYNRTTWFLVLRVCPESEALHIESAKQFRLCYANHILSYSPLDQLIQVSRDEVRNIERLSEDQVEVS